MLEKFPWYLSNRENSISRSEPLEFYSVLLVIMCRSEGMNFYGCLYSFLFPDSNLLRLPILGTDVR